MKHQKVRDRLQSHRKAFDVQMDKLIPSAQTAFKRPGSLSGRKQHAMKAKR